MNRMEKEEKENGWMYGEGNIGQNDNIVLGEKIKGLKNNKFK